MAGAASGCGFTRRPPLLPGDAVEAVEHVGDGDLQDQGGHALLVVVPRRLVPDRVGSRVGAVGQPGGGLGQRQGGALRVGEVRGGRARRTTAATRSADSPPLTSALTPLSTQAPQPLTWLTRRWTSPGVGDVTPPPSLAWLRATTACQAPGSTAAGFFVVLMPACSLLPGSLGILGGGCAAATRVPPFGQTVAAEGDLTRWPDSDSLALEFEAHRPHLRGVAYRVLGSASDADDAVQETWLRLSRTDVSGVVSLRAWLTTVISRVALNMLRSRGTRREDVSAGAAGEGSERDAPVGGGPPYGPEDEALLGDEVSAALQVVLDTLEPRERLAFVLHDLFAVPFDEIAPVVDTTSAAARQLASRPRRRLRAASPNRSPRRCRPAQAEQREVVDALLAAAREAQFAALLELLEPERGDARRRGCGPDGRG